MFRFTIRDVLWLTVLVAVGVAWWLQYRADQRKMARSQNIVEQLKGQFQMMDMKVQIENGSVVFEHEPDFIWVKKKMNR